ncbi:long-chain fatty acid--CoA ligase [Cognatishimia sp.]|uniref:AMP-dependent synthetase/ligase n=1 Tax=Cognatishimia sp. TaxID=2211648 RepID=UPI0035165551
MHDFGKDSFRTSVQVIADHSRRTPDKVAIRQKRFGVWNEITWSDLDAIVKELASGLIELGVKPGDKVGVLSENRQEWVLTQFAAQAVGAIVVGMYPTSPAAEIDHLVNASETEVLFIEDQEQFDKITELGERAKTLRQLVVFDPKGLRNETYLKLTSIDEMQAMGQVKLPTHQADIQARGDAVSPDDTALMVFTSGSTGAPKAAEISHGNFYASMRLTLDLFEGLPSDVNILSYLPLCHVAEQNMTVVNCLSARRTMNFGESLRTITLDLRDVAPELFFGVPRIWEKMQAGLLVQIKTANPVQRRLTELALLSAQTRSKTPRSQWSLSQRAANRIWDALVYRHIRSYLGLGRVKIALSAAAPISEDLLTFLRGIGVNIREIWGMTETSGAASIQPDWGDCDGRVGFFPDEMEAKIADDGELLVKGPIVFKGYFKNAEATASTLVDGWLHTGDVAEALPDGSFSIVDRKKDIMINAAGKNLTPSLIENTMKASPYIKECIVIADKRPYVSALIQIDFDTVRLWAEGRGISYTTFRSLAENPDIVDLIDKEVAKGNENLARVEQIKKVWLLPKELDHDDGEVTATMKVRRSKITEAYGDAIEGLYAA